jgi:hypothetical protein
MPLAIAGGEWGRRNCVLQRWLLCFACFWFLCSGTSLPDDSADGAINSAGQKSQVTIEPPSLEYKSRPLCIPAVETAELINGADTELSVYSVTTDNVHFHPSLFKASTLPPGGRLTISIVFLPRTIGHVEGTLVIQTSVGGFLYQINAQGVANPYRLHPFLTAKLPTGQTYSPPIQVYNPHETTLQIKEVYTSEGFLHLNLPQTSVGGDTNARTNGLWEVPSRQTKTVINVAFSSDNPGKYQGYVHVKTNYDTMIIPLEVGGSPSRARRRLAPRAASAAGPPQCPPAPTPCPHPPPFFRGTAPSLASLSRAPHRAPHRAQIIVIKGGIHRMPDEFDFGTLVSATDRVTLPLTLLNSAEWPVMVTDMYPLSPDPLLSLGFLKGTLLLPNVHTKVADVTYTGQEQGYFSGTVVARTNDSNPANTYIELTYAASVLHGELVWEPNTTFASNGGPISRTLTLTSKFSQPIELFLAEISDPNFAVLDFASGAALEPGGSIEALRLVFTPNSSDLLYQTELTIVTNASQDTGPRAAFVIPLSVYHGRLTYTLSPSCRGGLVSDLSDGDAVHDAIDFGLLAVSEKRVCTLHLNNSNPMPVNLNGVSTTLPKVLRIRLEAVLQNGEPVAVPAGSSAVLGGLLGGGSQGGPPLLILEAGSSATLQVELTGTDAADVSASGTLSFAADSGPVKLPVKYSTQQGSLTFSPVILRFSPSFPGIVLRKAVHAKSTFESPLTIHSIFSSDPRLITTVTNSTLYPGIKVQIGYVELDVSKMDEQDDYMSVTGAGQVLPGAPVDRAELQLLVKRRQRWATLMSRGAHDLRAALTVSTNVVAKSTVAVRSTLIWPKVASSLQLAFGLAQAGGTMPAYVSVRNRADRPIWVELVEQDTSLNLLEQLLEGEATETTARFHLLNNSAEVLRKAQLKPAAFQLPKERCASVLPTHRRP